MWLSRQAGAHVSRSVSTELVLTTMTALSKHHQPQEVAQSPDTSLTGSPRSERGPSGKLSISGDWQQHASAARSSLILKNKFYSLTVSHLLCASCLSASPGPSWWNACRPLSSGTSPTPACSAPYLSLPRPSISDDKREKEKWEKRSCKDMGKRFWQKRMEEDCRWVQTIATYQDKHIQTDKNLSFLVITATLTETRIWWEAYEASSCGRQLLNNLKQQSGRNQQEIDWRSVQLLDLKTKLINNISLIPLTERASCIRISWEAFKTLFRQSWRTLINWALYCMK